MRCFVAIELPEKIKMILRGVKFDENVVLVVRPSDYHLTLKFLGEISEYKLEKVKNELDRIKFKPFKLRLDNIGFFPKGGSFIRVIWVSVMPKRKVTQLKERIDDALVTLFDREKKFEPHITFGRVKSVKNRRKLIELTNLRMEEGFTVDSFKLIKSELTEDGAKYEILEEYS